MEKKQPIFVKKKNLLPKRQKVPCVGVGAYGGMNEDGGGVQSSKGVSS